MNILSLRVASIKGTFNIKKNSEVRVEKMIVTEKFIDHPGATEVIRVFNEASNVEVQVNQVRAIQSNEEFPQVLKLKILSAMYLSAPLKHPVRGAIVKIFQSNYKDCDDLSGILKDQLELFLDAHRTLSDWHGYFSVISSLTGLFENIIVTRAPLSLLCESKVLFEYLLDVLETILSEYLSNRASPSVTNEILLLNHNILRVILAVSQEFGRILKTNDADFIRLKSLLGKLLDDPDVPMDTKTNCGHLGIIIAKLNDQYDSLIARQTPGSFYENAGIVVDLARGDGLQCPQSWKLLNKIAIEVTTYAVDNSKEQQMVLASSRLIFRIAKFLPQLISRPGTDKDVTSIIHNLTDFTFSHLENFMDSVRHMSRDTLKLILAFCLAKEIELEVAELFQRISEGCSRYVRFLTLSCIASVYGARRILHEIPGIIPELIRNFKENSFDVSAGNCFESLMLENRKEETCALWLSRWIDPLIKFLNDLPIAEQNTKIVLETLISKAVKNDNEIIRIMIANREIPISIRLTVLTMAKRCGKLSAAVADPQLWKGSISVEDLKLAMVNFDDRIRIQSLRLVIETLKITEPYQDIDLSLLRFFYKYNANCQSPATRDQIVAQFQSCFAKLTALLQNCRKRREMGSVEIYRSFLIDLIADSFANLSINGNFTRRNMSLIFIDEICGVLKGDQGDDEEDREAYEITDWENINLLVNCLADSYECNKALALKILLNYCNKDYLKEKHTDLERIHSLITSVNPTDSTTGAYHLQLIVSLEKLNVTSFIAKSYEMLRWLCQIVEIGIHLANESLTKAARMNPIYGGLLCIRHLLFAMELNKLKGDPKWRQFISQLIKICFDCLEAVKSIVNNSSPEGHLPNDFGNISEDFSDHSITDNVTPQMILLMGWRTIKEVSLLLGEISNYPLVKANGEGLVTVDEFFRIGESFRELLAETKHRGAFEQAYVGFSKLCSRLWIAQEEELHSRPMQWLAELMDEVKGVDQSSSKICATRRSAGVPYMVQALITSEIQVCSNRALTFSMSTLLEMCESNISTAEAKTHALNILRALFRCTDLSDAVVPFVDRGIMAAILSFAAKTWPEKNSATLLFSALVTRIFGVQRTKDCEVLNVRNKMTGRIFFLRYPKLYDFFLDQLAEVQEAVERDGQNVKLFPILLVLSRLYPSALEGTESSLSLNAFVTQIEACSRCREMKSRVLIGKSIASLLTSNLSWEYLNRILGNLKGERNLNACHSKLLIIQQVLSRLVITHELANEANNLLRELINLPLNSSHWLLTKAFLEIFVVVLSKLPSQLVNPANAEGLGRKCAEVGQVILLSQQRRRRHNNYQEMGFVVTISPLVVLQLQLRADDNIVPVLVGYLAVAQFREAAVSVALLLVVANEEQQELPDDLEMGKWERAFVRDLTVDQRVVLKAELEANQTVPQLCQAIVADGQSSYDLRNKALALLAYYPTFKEEDDKSLSCERIEEDLLNTDISYQSKAATYKWYLRNCERLNHALDLAIIRTYCSIENTFNVRLTSAEILKRIPATEKVIAAGDCLEIVQYTCSVLLLLCDEDAEIRESIGNTIHQLVSGSGCWIEIYAQEQFIGWLANQLVQRRGQSFAADVLKGVIGEYNHQSPVIPEDEGTEKIRVFDRNEVNSFAEDQAVINLLRTHLGSLDHREK